MEAEFLDPVGGQRQADQAARMARHEIHDFRRRHLGGNGKITLVSRSSSSMRMYMRPARVSSITSSMEESQPESEFGHVTALDTL